MHHPTDLVASIILAAAWLAVTYWVIRPDLDAPPNRWVGPQRTSASVHSGPESPAEPVGTPAATRG
jgi:membrane-associated phospholipid phosphatase